MNAAARESTIESTTGRQGLRAYLPQLLIVGGIATFLVVGHATGLLALPSSEREMWLLAISAMTNTACSLLGCYLILRRLSLMGDALSHAVLPGLVVAYLLSGSIAIGFMLAGAFAAGLLATFLTSALERQGGVPGDASMGVVFTSLFALGVILVHQYSGNVDLDTDCVLQGQLPFVAEIKVHVPGFRIGDYEFLNVDVPRSALSIGFALAANVIFILMFYKELKLSSFDPALATTMGFRSGLLHYLLMAMVAMTTVGSFEAVGSILVIAMLIVPGATAHLLTDRLSRMLWIAVGVGLLSAYIGLSAAAKWNVEPAGLTTVFAGAIYFLAVLFSPRYGIVSTLVRNMQVAVGILREDLLAMLYRLDELAVGRRLGPREAVHALGGGLLARWGLFTLLRQGRVLSADGGLQLTDLGRQQAASLVRSHRLWEAYLHEHLGLPLDHVHDPAARMEHYIGPQLQEQIAADLRQGERDPHGREIPTSPSASSP